ncbi:MAG: fused MFS/spermidine synthase [Deltaproteobacteria bacterium]|nr:fused MFS/spermidine synthase [Deltaproteobacteria bacterium]
MSRLLLLSYGLLMAGAGSARSEEPNGPASRIIHEEITAFGRLLVVDEGDLRMLRFGSIDGDDQSRISINRPEQVPMDYVRDASLALAWVPKVKRVGMIGLGGGSFTNLLHQKLPGVEIHAVEISKEVAEVAKRFFRVPKHPDYHIHVEDGADYLKRTDLRFDILMLDAYDSDDMPAHLKSVFFFRLAQSRLKPNGLVVINLSLDEAPERVVARAFRQVFPQALCIRSKDANNLLLFAHARAALERGSALKAKALKVDQDLHLPFRLADIAARIKQKCP